MRLSLPGKTPFEEESAVYSAHQWAGVQPSRQSLSLVGKVKFHPQLREIEKSSLGWQTASCGLRNWIRKAHLRVCLRWVSQRVWIVGALIY